jgi:methyl-accepting chemotaxis protein
MLMLSLLRRFTIQQRMHGAIALVLLLFALVGGTGVWGGLELSHLNQEFMTHGLKELHNTSDIRQALGAVRQNEKNMVIDYEDEAKVIRHQEAWMTDLVRVRQGFNDLLKGEEDADNPLAREALKQLDQYQAATAHVIKQIKAGAYDNARVADRMLAKAKEHIVGAEHNLERITQIVDNESAAMRDEFDRAMRRTIWIFCGIVVVAVVVVVPLTLLNASSITTPIVQASTLANAIAAGDLSGQVVPEGCDEASDLMESLKRMQATLVTLVRDMGRTAHTIETAGREIAEGNHNLSSRTVQASTNLKHTATSIEDLTSAVRQSAESASQANEMATDAAEVAQRGGTAVGQVVGTMEEIDAASQKIASIIGVIDDIAFQTNILALNAAVEAARAGEQGRGFAVVAAEVRLLAQRSADAAGEIKSLIVTSVEKVEHGSRQARRAGQTIQELVASVQRVSSIIGEVTQAATEQSHGIAQVNSAVADLDRMTQQNAMLVQQSAIASDDLRAQATTLANRVKRFRLDDEAEPEVSAEPPAEQAAPLDAAPVQPSAAAVAAEELLSQAMAAEPAPAALAPPPKPPAKAPAPAPAASDTEWETF